MKRKRFDFEKMKQDPELWAEYNKAFALASPYRWKINYRLSILKNCNIHPNVIVDNIGRFLVAFSASNHVSIHPHLLGGEIL